MRRPVFPPPSISKRSKAIHYWRSLPKTIDHLEAKTACFKAFQAADARIDENRDREDARPAESDTFAAGLVFSFRRYLLLYWMK